MNRILRLFNLWERVEQIPIWVLKSFRKEFNKNYYKGNKNPYDKSYYFNGKTFQYKVKVIGDIQGGSYYYYRRLRK